MCAKILKVEGEYLIETCGEIYGKDCSFGKDFNCKNCSLNRFHVGEVVNDLRGLGILDIEEVNHFNHSLLLKDEEET